MKRLRFIGFVAKAGFDKYQSPNIMAGLSLELPFIGLFIAVLRFGVMLGMNIERESKNQEAIRKLFEHD